MKLEVGFKQLPMISRDLAFIYFFTFCFWLIGLTYFIIDRIQTKQAETAYSIASRRLMTMVNKLESQVSESKRLRNVMMELIDLKKKSQSAYKLDGKASSAKEEESKKIAIPVLVLACDRPEALKNHVDALLRLRPSAEQFPIIISLDCNKKNIKTKLVADSYGDKITVTKQPNQTEPDVGGPKSYHGYYKIARHYKWALNFTFSKGYKAAIVTEDDLRLAPDFFEYFLATYSLLEKDRSLWCVSGWNDNGIPELINHSRPDLLYRTDFFPGLGWMLRRDTWEELKPKWPEGFWDDWIRAKSQRKGRACIRPEISRTAMSEEGLKGVSGGMYFDTHLRNIVLNSQAVPFTSRDLSYLTKDNYDLAFVKKVYDTPRVSLEEAMVGKYQNGKSLPEEIRIEYRTPDGIHHPAKVFGLMSDFRAGIPRTAYRGIVSFICNGSQTDCGGRRVYLTPPPGVWTDYNENWN